MPGRDVRAELTEAIRQTAGFSSDLGMKLSALVVEVVRPLEETIRRMSDEDPFRAVFIAFTDKQAQIDIAIIGPLIELKLVQEKARVAEAENSSAQLIVDQANIDLQTLKWTTAGKLVGAALGSGGVVGLLGTAALAAWGGP